jgi:uncharacterized protein YjbI with pentapeptide repeats
VVNGRRLHGELTTELYVRKVHLRDVDFSGCAMHVRFAQSKLVNCRFRRTRFNGFGLVSSDCERCEFVDAYMVEAALGIPVADGTRCRFTDTEFTRCNLRYASARTADFDRCTFSDVKTRCTSFGASSLRDCVFRGGLDDVDFGDGVLALDKRLYPEFPRPLLERVDFSNALLRGVRFRDVTLKEVIWPGGNDHLVVAAFAEAAERVITDSAGSPEREPTGRFFELLLENGGPGNPAVFYKPELAQILGEAEADRVVRILEPNRIL